MPEEVNIRISPDAYDDAAALRAALARKLGLSPKDISYYELLRRSIDARRQPTYQLRYRVWRSGEEPASPTADSLPTRDVSQSPEVHIIGTGPGGLFAALQLIEAGLRPILIERGKAVRPRRRDLARLNREGIVNPDSNYCFGEGGAGTFSDGKLYTRAKKRGDVRRVLDQLVAFGATRDILIDAHPHIGTNKLPGIIQAIRTHILACGGEVNFDTRLTDVEVQNGQLRAIILNGDTRVATQSVVLATGHSARDVFSLLHKSGLHIEAKPFALGVRVEHPQALIDQIQYRCKGDRHPNLPAASYSLVEQVEGMGVYSFCMCPGGIICPAATAPGELVVNGWSPSMRNTGYANSGMVVAVEPAEPDDPMRGIEFQAQIERAAERAGGGAQVAPATRLEDFVRGKISADLPDCSYLPGIASADLSDVLPNHVHRRLRAGFRAFGRKLPGYLTNDAVVVAVESRTSSPVRIPRDERLMHPQAAGLFPCGEGAGYAGGIMSAALDGARVADAVARYMRAK